MGPLIYKWDPSFINEDIYVSFGTNGTPIDFMGWYCKKWHGPVHSQWCWQFAPQMSKAMVKMLITDFLYTTDCLQPGKIHSACIHYKNSV